MDPQFLIKIKPSWLEACGKGPCPEVRAFLSPGPARMHNSAMGRCFEAAMPDGRLWTVFECRLESVREITCMEDLQSG